MLQEEAYAQIEHQPQSMHKYQIGDKCGDEKGSPGLSLRDLTQIVGGQH